MNEINLVLNGASVMILIMRRGLQVSFRPFLSAGGAPPFCGVRIRKNVFFWRKRLKMY